GDRRRGRPRRRQAGVHRRERQAPRLPRQGGRARRHDRGGARGRAAGRHEGRREADARDGGWPAYQGDRQMSDVETSGPESTTEQVDVPEQYRKSASPAAKKSIIQMQDVTKTFVRGKEPLTVLDGLSLDIAE